MTISFLPTAKLPDLKRLIVEAGRIGTMHPVNVPEPLAAPVAPLCAVPLIAVVGAGWAGKSTLAQRLCGKSDDVKPDAELTLRDQSVLFFAASPDRLPMDVSPQSLLPTGAVDAPPVCFVEFPALDAVDASEPIFARFLPRCDYLLLCIASSRTIGQTETQWLAQNAAFLPTHGRVVITWADQCASDDLTVCAEEAMTFVRSGAKGTWHDPVIAGQFADAESSNEATELSQLPDVAGVFSSALVSDLRRGAIARLRTGLRDWQNAALKRVADAEARVSDVARQRETERNRVGAAVQEIEAARKQYHNLLNGAGSAASTAMGKQLVSTGEAWKAEINRVIPEIKSPDDVPGAEEAFGQFLQYQHGEITRAMQEAVLPTAQKAVALLVETVTPHLGRNALSLDERMVYLPGSADAATPEAGLTVLSHEPEKDSANVQRLMRDGLTTAAIFTLPLAIPVVGWLIAPVAAGGYWLFAQGAKQEEERNRLRQGVSIAAREQWARFSQSVRHDGEEKLRETITLLRERGDARFDEARKAVTATQVPTDAEGVARATFDAVQKVRPLLEHWERERFHLFDADAPNDTPTGKDAA